VFRSLSCFLLALLRAARSATAHKHPQPKKGVNPVGCLIFRLRMLALWFARSASLNG